MKKEAAPPRRCKAVNAEGAPCGKAPRRGRDLCGNHGGARPAGIASPLIVTGRHSKYLPTNLSDRYHEALADPELTSIRSEIAVLDSRFSSLLEKLQGTESAEAWATIATKIPRLVDLLDRGDLDEAKVLVDELAGIVRTGLTDFSTWREIYAVTDQKARLTEIERKQKIELDQFVPIEKVYLLVMALISLVRENVKDEDVLRRISRGIGRMVGDSSEARVRALPERSEVTPGVHPGGFASTSPTPSSRADRRRS